MIKITSVIELINTFCRDIYQKRYVLLAI